MSDIAVRIEHLSKMYRLGVINNRSLHKDIQTWIALKRGKEDPNSRIGENKYAGDKDRFWALKDISFDVKRGDRIGIIGKNGAGKSTLLKILSRITAPTEGSVKIKGKIASLLEVGTGFHAELTGRENIYLNGAILGMKKRQVAEKMDSIIEFSGIEHHIDTPVKRYSSGMYVRLAFAVAAHLDSDILIADEVLAVGDAAFQKKALGKMQDLSTGEGRTVFFVSHNMGSIKQLCQTGLLLEAGVVSSHGTVGDVIGRYLTGYINNSLVNIENDDRREGTREIIFTDFYVSRISGEKTSVITTGEDIIFNFIIKSKKNCKIDLGFSLHDNINNSTISILYSGYQNFLADVKEGYNLISCHINDIAICMPQIRIAGLIKLQNGDISDWPKFALGAIEIIKGNYYGTGKDSHHGVSYLIKGKWEVNFLHQ